MSKIYFIGIGGIGVSGLASIYQKQGHTVSGSDAEESEVTTELKKQGIKVFIGHNQEQVPGDLDLVIYSEAVPETNPELKKAKELGFKCLSGAEALGQLSRDYFTIAVSGMHGKSTTASMISQILIKAGLDPTFIIGAKQGWRLGNSRYLIIEADDYQAKFLNYHPNVLVLTNIEEEHMDYFRDLPHILQVFKQYVGQVKDYVIANKDDNNVRAILEARPGQEGARALYYSLKDPEVAILKDILQVPGQHNVSNALAALRVARLLAIDDKVIFKALAGYRGVWRRFEESEIKVGGKTIRIVSDYAHHPTEIQATLQAAQERFQGKSFDKLRTRIWVVFQPHQYQRTFYLFDNFVKVFKQAQGVFGVDRLIITDIYDVAGRENNEIKAKVNSQKLVWAIDKPWASYIPQAQLADYLNKNLQPGTVLLIMGAGDIYKLPQELAGLAKKNKSH